WWLSMTVSRDAVKAFAIIKSQPALSDAAEIVSLLQYSIENRSEVAGRRVDDLQDLGGRGLLLQCFAGFGDEPRVLDRGDSLCREILQQGNLLIAEWTHFGAIDCDSTEQRPILAQCDRGIAPSATPVDEHPSARRASTIGFLLAEII